MRALVPVPCVVGADRPALGLRSILCRPAVVTGMIAEGGQMTSVEQTQPPPPPTGPKLATSQRPSDVPPPETFLVARPEKPVTTWAEVAGLLAAGLLLELGFRAGAANLAAALSVLTLAGVLLSGSRLEQRTAKWLVIGAASLSPWLAVRASASLTTLTFLASASLLALATGLSKTGSLTDLKARSVLNHLMSPSIEWGYGLQMSNRLIAPSFQGRPLRAVWRGLLVASPIVVLFALLLSSADQVFSNLLVVDRLPALTGHALAAMALAVLFMGLTSRAAHKTEPYLAGPLSRPLGSVEVHVILGSVAVLFAAFVATQVVVALGGDHVFEAENLTQAQFARRGFFQLLWVAALVIALLGVIRSIRAGGSASEPNSVQEGRDLFKQLAVVVLALTLVITAISIQRLLQYVDTFGYTPLRLWSLVAAVWIGVIILADIASIAGLGGTRSWFPGFFILSAAVFVFALNLVNPDAQVAEYNTTNRSQTTVDTSALAELSDDAIPAAIDYLDQLSPTSYIEFRGQLCQRSDLSAGYGVFGANVAKRRADTLLDAVCGDERQPSSNH